MMEIRTSSAHQAIGLTGLAPQQVPLDFIQREQPLGPISNVSSAFAQGMRQNDIDERMRTIASQLTPIEMHSLAEFYAAGVDSKAR